MRFAPTRDTRLRHERTADGSFKLFIKHLLDVADFLLNFASDLIGSAFVLQVLISCHAASRFLRFAFEISGAALNFVLCAVFHKSPWLSLRAGVVRFAQRQTAWQARSDANLGCGYGRIYSPRDGRKSGVHPLELAARCDPGPRHGPEGTANAETLILIIYLVGTPFVDAPYCFPGTDKKASPERATLKMIRPEVGVDFSRASLNGRISRAAGRPARRCGRRSSRAALGANSPANLASDSYRSRRELS